MQNFTYIITDSLGIHARPAGLLVKEAAKYKSSIIILAEGKSADARKLLALMGLGIRQGTEITCRVEGEDEESAAANMKNFFTDNL